MKKSRQFVLMLLSLAALCGILASCKSNNVPNDDDTNTIVWKVYDTASVYVETWEESLNKLLAEKGAEYTVKIEAYGDSIYAETRDDIPIDLLTKMKESGEKVDIITATPTGMYQLWNSSEDDIATEYIETYNDAVSMGLLISLDDYLESDEGEILRAAIMPENLERAKIDGKVYGISQWMRTVSATVYNKELLEKYDISTSELSSELFSNEDILQIVYEGERESSEAFAVYLGQIGENDFGMWTIDQCEVVAFDPDSETFINIFESEEFKEYLEKLYTLKDKNLLSYKYSVCDNFFAASSSTKNNEIYEDIYRFTDVNGNIIEKEVVVIPDLESPLINIYDVDALTGIASWSENYDMAFDFLTRLFTDSDIANLIQYGVEGENYIIDDGKVVSQSYTRKNNDGTTTTINENEWSFATHFTNTLITYHELDMAEDKFAYMETYFENEPEGLPVGFRFDAESVSDELEAIDSVWFYEIVETPLYKFEADDIETALDEINQLLENAGIDKVLEEIQRQYDEWKAEQE